MKRLILTLALAAALPSLPAWADRDPIVQQHLDSAQQALSNGDYEQAVDELQEAASAAPGDHEIAAKLLAAEKKDCGQYVKQGHEAIADQKYDDAVSAFENALQVLPKDPAALKGKREAENWPHAAAYVKAAKEHLARGDYAYAIAYFQRAYDLVGDPAIAKLLAEAKGKKAHR